MGKANRERRRMKEKARKRTQGARSTWGGSSGPGSFGPGSFEPGGFDPGGFDAPPTDDEVAGTLIDQAILGLCQGPPPVVDRAVGQLAAVTDARWRQTVDRLLDEVLREALTGLWRNGWQPVDLFRVVARDSDAAQLRLLRAGVAAELARYAAATVDPRWAAQLAEARAAVWWEPRLSAVQASAQAHGADRRGFVLGAVQLLHSLAHLPPLDLLGPIPGTAVPAARAPKNSVDERILGRVRAFLAKAESTPYPAEAETFTAAAQALMARHSIDHALLMATGRTPSDEPTARRVGVDNPYEAPKVSLLDAIASANRCRTVWSKEFGFVNVIGFPTDLDTVELIFTSLLVQATTAMTREGQRTAAGGRARSKSFRQSFLLSYAMRIRERLTQATREQTETAAAEPGGSRLLPVLSARSDAVDATTDRMFPKLQQTSLGRIGDAAGWTSGRAAADLAVLNPATALPD